MDKVTTKILNVILSVFIIFSVFSIMIECKVASKRIILIILLSLICIITFIRQMLIKEGGELANQCMTVTIFINSALIYWILLVGGGNSAEILVFILIVEVTVSYSYKNSLMFAIVNYISFAIIYYLKLSHISIDDVANIFLQVFSFIFVYGFAFIVKHQILQKEEIQKTSRELKLKKEELEKAYQKILESYDTMEQVTILKERNRIAGEIHDTVGHTLTTVLIEMEACKRLMKKDVELSIEKLDLAQEQVRKGLNDIRKSVKALSDYENYPIDFVSSLKTLIFETEKHGGVKIQFDIESNLSLSQNVEKVIYRALQEGLTNGMRHGKCLSFKLSLKIENHILKYILENDGQTFENTELGFGLSNMKFRVEQLNGKFIIDSCTGKGCIIKIEIPISN